jgi:cholesterol oxidase
MRDVAAEMGVAHTFRKTPVGVFFGRPGERVADPYFGGVGPDRKGCISCGACMTGCRHDAKNRLDLNYLYLAERGGAQVHPDTEVRTVRPRSAGGYLVSAGAPAGRGGRRLFTADQVVFAAGALGTQRLLHRLRAEGQLPLLSARLGHLTRTNSEAILGALARDTSVDYSKGIAITSSFHPDADTHIEPVRYGPGDNAMGLLGTIMVDGGGAVPRPVRAVATVVRHPVLFARSLSVRRWSERTVIVLVMQSLDNSIRVFRKRGLLGARLTSAHGTGEPNPTWIPVANDAARRVAARIGGQPGSAVNEAFLNVPTTAHIIGGVVIGDSAAAGVIDPYHRVFGYAGLHVVDGSAIPANLGVNPSLTITALAERSVALWPNNGDPDPRPAPGSAYADVAAVAPRQPLVPAHAPAALSW